MNLFHRRNSQLARALNDMGNTHDVQAIAAAIADGTMQSFTKGESWIVTQISYFPRRKVCDVFLAVGDLDELRAMHDDVIAFAKNEGCDLIRAIGREGFTPSADREDWHKGASVYWKEL